MGVRTAQASIGDDPNNLSLGFADLGSLSFGIVSVSYDDTQDSSDLIDCLRVIEAALLQDIGR